MRELFANDARTTRLYGERCVVQFAKLWQPIAAGRADAAISNAAVDELDIESLVQGNAELRWRV
jgi:hypothetical protein